MPSAHSPLFFSGFLIFALKAFLDCFCSQLCDICQQIVPSENSAVGVCGWTKYALVRRGCDRGVQSGVWDALRKNKVKYANNIYAMYYIQVSCTHRACRAFILIIQHSNSCISAETRSMASSVLWWPSLFCSTFMFDSLSNGNNDMDRYKGKMLEK